MTILANSDPLVERHPTGEVAVSFDDGDSWVRFKTVAHYNQAREHLDREQVSHERAAIAAYHARMQSLMGERGILRGVAS